MFEVRSNHLPRNECFCVEVKSRAEASWDPFSNGKLFDVKPYVLDAYHVNSL